MTATTTQKPYRVHRGGPNCWYVQEVITGELKGLNFRTRKAAQEAVDGWNERRAAK